MPHEINLRALITDRLMSRLIPGGGLMVLAAVCGILVFLVWEVMPLFVPASAKASFGAMPELRARAVQIVEDGSAAWWIAADGVHVLEPEGKPRSLAIPGFESAVFVGAEGAPAAVSAAGALAQDGRFVLVRVEKEGSVVRALALDLIETTPGPVDAVACARDEAGRARVAKLKNGQVTFIGVGGMGDPVETPLSTPGVTSMGFNSIGTLLCLGTSSGRIEVWDVADAMEPKSIQVLECAAAVTAVGFVLGDETLIAGNAKGGLSGYFRVRHIRLTNSGDKDVRIEGDLVPARGSVVVRDRDHAKSFKKGGAIRIEPGGMPFLLTRSFPGTASRARAIAASPRNKTFVVACEDGSLSVYNATTEARSVRIPPTSAKPAGPVAFSPRSDALVAWCDGIRTWILKNPHPETSFSSLLLPVWYESYPEEEWVWQSSSGTQETEAKLSLWPLVFGTLKGTFYTLIFSVPIALAAAVYVARFASARLKAWVKPAIEIMAGLPSVVTGMVAALWLAPIFERNLFAFFVCMFLLPATFFGVLFASRRFLLRFEANPRAAVELFGVAAAVLVSIGLSLLIAPGIESLAFKGDFRQWLYDTFSIHYDLRNGFIVGIALGFAVIPLIFSIAEDAISGVPATMTSAALALGATRWQTVRYVILPAAASGIFAAIVLGLGRAAGETMIVVMAAGNTPILDPAPWNGMRTLSAAMAIEMPEAPHHGTLYRVLFLAGLILFAFTALLNTLAEVVGSRLRQKYGRF